LILDGVAVTEDWDVAFKHLGKNQVTRRCVAPNVVLIIGLDVRSQ